MNQFKLIEVKTPGEDVLVIEGELSAIEAKIVELKAADVPPVDPVTPPVV